MCELTQLCEFTKLSKTMCEHPVGVFAKLPRAMYNQSKIGYKIEPHDY